MKIKICGITEIETLNFLIENGVDYVGFIFMKIVLEMLLMHL